jgi:hypothetical protein
MGCCVGKMVVLGRNGLLCKVNWVDMGRNGLEDWVAVWEDWMIVGRTRLYGRSGTGLCGEKWLLCGETGLCGTGLLSKNRTV